MTFTEEISFERSFRTCRSTWLWVFLYMTFASLFLLLVVVTREIHPEDIFGVLTCETHDAHQRVSKEELIHMLLIPVVEVSQMIQYTLNLTSPSSQTS